MCMSSSNINHDFSSPGSIILLLLLEEPGAFQSTVKKLVVPYTVLYSSEPFMVYIKLFPIGQNW